jgi:hypothetical protein
MFYPNPNAAVFVSMIEQDCIEKEFELIDKELELEFLKQTLTYEELFYTEEELQFLEQAHKEANLIVKLLDEANTVIYPINRARMAHISAVNAAIATRTSM